MSIKEDILNLLADGRPHSREELHEVCGPSSSEVVRKHICILRKELRPFGEDLALVIRNGKTYYQHVRLLASPYSGKR